MVKKTSPREVILKLKILKKRKKEKPDRSGNDRVGEQMLRKFSEIGYLILAIIIFIFIFTFTDLFDMPNLYLIDDEIISYSGGWTLQDDDDQKRFDLPYYFNIDKSEPLVIRNIIPDHVPIGGKVVMKSYRQSVVAKIDGKTVYAMGEDESRFPGKNLGNFWAVIDIRPEDKGKVIELTLFSHTPTSQGYAPEIFITSGSSLFLLIFLEKGIWNLVIMLVIILGLVLIITYFLTGLSKEKNRSILYLGCYSLVIGGWFLAESGMLQLLTKNTYLIVRLSPLMILLSPVIFGLYLREATQMKKRFFTDLLGAIIVVSSAICLLLESMDILGLWDTNLIGQAWIMIFCTYYLIIFAIEFFYYKNKKISHDFKAIFIFLILAIVEAIVFSIRGFKQTSYFMLTGTTIYIILMTIHQLNESKGRRKIKEEKEFFEKLAYTDVLTGAANRAQYVRDMDKITNPRKIAIVQVDTDRLKYINDYFGHTFGDQAIIDTCDVLQKHFSPIGKVYRIGGDEFTVIIKNDNLDNINQIIEQVKQEVALIAEDRVYDFSVSFGLTIHNASIDQDIYATAVRADKRMYKDKTRLRGTVPQKMPVNFVT